MLNRAVLIGRLTRDPEVTVGKKQDREWAVARFTVAYNHRYRKGDEWVDQPHFFDVRVFGKLARAVGEKYQKGDLVFVEGRLSQEKWETQEGQKKTTVRIIADTVRRIRPSEGRVTVETAPEERTYEDDEDIPF